MNAPTLTRRGLMVGAGGLAFALAVTGGDVAAAARTLKLSPWVTLATDGTVEIMSAACELGQGTSTHQPLVLAEEMDADWSRVRLVPAPADDKTYGNPGVGGIMYTNAARTLSGYFPLMRTFGAQVRLTLMQAAANRWGVPVAEVSTEPHAVVHAPSGRRLGYGEIAAFMELPATAPEITPAQLKKPADYRYLGKAVMRADVPSKTRGAAVYGIDVQRPGMLYGAVLRAPVEGAGPAEIKDEAARKVPGVIEVVRLPYGVGVVADRPWAAFSARDALEVIWDRKGKAWGHDSDAALAAYRAAARDLTRPGRSGGERVGDPDAAFASAATVLEAEYACDLAYHAQMEPLSAVAEVSSDGTSAAIWTGTQSQTICVDSAARTLGVAPEKIAFNGMMVGGGYGRRGHREQEWVTDALLLSKAVKKPVKVIWTREDDIHNGRFRPLTAHYMQAGLDASGKVIAWRHRVSADQTFAFQDPVRFARANGRDGMVAGGAEAAGFAIPNRVSEVLVHDNGVRTSAWRGIGNGPNKFAIDCFMDEIARHRGMDPVAFRLELIGADTRARRVIEAVARLANWGTTTPGRAKGFTFVDYSRTLMGSVAEVSVDRQTGEVKVHDFWTVIDPGFAVQPENIRAQVEGGVVYALGSVLFERVSIKDGAVEQSNFHDYRLPRMGDIPEIHVEIISDPNAAPLGIGEQTVVTVAPAICNAVTTALGKRPRHLPLTPERVLELIAS